MKRLKFLFALSLFLLVSLVSLAQMVGVGTQIVKDENIQFAANISMPYFSKYRPVNFHIWGGVDYTGGKGKLSGLTVKPVILTLDALHTVNQFYNGKTMLWLSCDGGYLFNFKESKTDGFVVTPNIMIGYDFVFIKAGYTYNITRKRDQFFLRAGLCLPF